MGAITRFHQSVRGRASRSSSQKESAASTTDSLKSTRGGPNPGCSAFHIPLSAARSRSTRARSATATLAASDSLWGVNSTSMRSPGVLPYAIQTSGRIGKSCVALVLRPAVEEFLDPFAFHYLECFQILDEGGFIVGGE